MRISELNTPFANAQAILRRLKSKYSNLDAQLVITSGYGQSDLTTDGLILFDRAASMFANSIERKELLILFDVHKDLLRRNSDLKSVFIKTLVSQIHNRIDALLAVSEIVETSQIELRFGQLDYELIAQLKKDPLIDQELTPQTRASIKVCIGTLQRLRSRKVLGVQSDRASVHMQQQNAVF